MQDCVRLTQTLQDITRDYQHDYCVSRTHFVLPCIAQTHNSQALTWRSLTRHSYILQWYGIYKKKRCTLRNKGCWLHIKLSGYSKTTLSRQKLSQHPLNDPKDQGVKYTSNSHTTVTLILGHKSRNIGNRTVLNNSHNTSDIKKGHSVSQATMSNEVWDFLHFQ